MILILLTDKATIFGRQYRTGIYWEKDDEKSKELVIDFIKYQEENLGNIAIEISLKLKNIIKIIWKKPNGYCNANLNLINEPLLKDDRKFLESIEEKQKLLDAVSYDVMVNSGTERPFTSELNEEYRKGIYVDKLSKKPLFVSTDKFDAGCGWPSFSKPIISNYLEEVQDNSYGMRRTEVRSKFSDLHLGHVFSDGPKDKGSLRYCINGSALEFIPYEEMDEKGYSDYKVFVK